MGAPFNLKSLLSKYRTNKKENAYKNDRTIPINLCSLSNFKLNSYLCIYLITILVAYIIGLQGPRIVNFMNSEFHSGNTKEITFISQVISVYLDTIWIFFIPNFKMTDFSTNFTLEILCKAYNQTINMPSNFYPKDYTNSQNCNNYLLNHKSENFKMVESIKNIGQKLLFRSAITSRDPFILAGQIKFSPDHELSPTDASNFTIKILTYNPDFVSAEMWAHSFGSCLSLLAMGIFYWRIRKFFGEELLYEQKWMFILLPLNFFYNNPLSAISLIWPTFAELFPTTYLGTILFLAALTTFWVSFYNRLRQDPKNVSQTPVCILAHFYTCKILLGAIMWISAVLLYHSQPIEEPAYQLLPGSNVFHKVMRKVTLVCFLAYTLILMISIFRSYTELKNLALYEIRLRFLTLISVAPFITMLIFAPFWRSVQPGGNLGTLKYLKKGASWYTTQRDPCFAYTSFAGLLCHRVCLNFFVLAMAYAFSPTKAACCRNVEFAEYGMKDILNNSDDEEDLIYSLRFKKKGYSSKKQAPVVRGIFPIDMELNDDDL